MTSSRLRLEAALLLALGYGMGLAAYPGLTSPFLDRTPSARGLVAFALPTTALVIDALFRSLWKHDRIRSGNGAFESTYHSIVLFAILFIVLLHGMVVGVLTGLFEAVSQHLLIRLAVVMLGLTLVAIGNLLPRTRPNVAIGVRTARTLGNTQLWQHVHRASGYATVAVGLVVTLAGVAVERDAVGAIASAAAVCAAIAVLIVYRRYPRPDAGA